MLGAGSSAGVGLAMGRAHGVMVVAVCGVGRYGAGYVACTWAVVGGAGGDCVGVFVRGVEGGGDWIVERGARWRGVVCWLLDWGCTRAPVVV